MNDSGTAFETERNVIHAAYGLDGGGSVAADDQANVYVAWHAPKPDVKGADGASLAWNLVQGIHDAPGQSERTIWIDGEPSEPPPCRFDPELRNVGQLRFAAEVERARRDNLLVVRSVYRQPFGVFSGELPGDVVLAEGYGVMEAHDAWW